MAKSQHVHDMKPNRLPMPTFYQCSSCVFKCTPAAVNLVRRMRGKHVRVRPTDPQANIPWNGN